jgi:hypothetical protein
MADTVKAAKDRFGGSAGQEALQALFAFAREHRDGRYLVEEPSLFNMRFAAFDAHAITSYLGAQGNQAASGQFREAAVTSLFINPQKNALSADADLWGISSALGSDLDFERQPVAAHLERCRRLGVRYLVIFSDRIRRRLNEVPSAARRFDAAGWTIYDIGPAAPRAEALAFLPALVISPFTVKARRSEELNFTRLAEEQFFDGWFDVLLAHSPAGAIEEEKRLDAFGALILTRYPCGDCEDAYRRIRDFAQRKPVICVRREERLFHRLEVHREELPGLVVLDGPADPGEPVDSFFGPSTRYANSRARTLWKEIRSTLERSAIAVPGTPVRVETAKNQMTLHTQGAAPIFVRTTAHPDWTRTDGAPVYTAGPMMMLTFVDRSASLVFERRPTARAAGGASLAACAGLLLWCAAPRRRKRGEA